MFKGYDVRGLYGKEVSEQKFFWLGKALSEVSNSTEAVIGMDYRQNNDLLASALMQGFGKKIVFLGRAPTPCTAFLSKKLGASVTASHNPTGYNGAKPIKEKRNFLNKELMKLRKEYERQEKKGVKYGGVKELPAEDEELKKEYLEALPEFSGGIYDLSGGAACAFKKIFPQTIYSEPDPCFEKHSAEPTEKTLSELMRLTKEKNCVGFAFDGDGDRVAAIDCGQFIDASVLGAFAAVKKLSKKSKIVASFDVSDEIHLFLENEGFQLFDSVVGTPNMNECVLKANADYSLERSGHYGFSEHMIFSDGLHVAAILSNTRARELLEFSKQFKNKTKSEKVQGKPDFKKVRELIEASKPNSLEELDGVKARYDDCTLLIRASNTEPITRITVEAKNEEIALKKLGQARELLMQLVG